MVIKTKISTITAAIPTIVVAVSAISVVLVTWSISTVFAHRAVEGPEAPGFPHECIQGTPGNDVRTVQCMQGRNGDDTITCDNSNHCHLYGDSGNDRIVGGNGDDNLHGTDGNDLIVARDGNDELHGDPGDDLLTGGTGTDHFNCGDGTDIVTDYKPQERDNFFDKNACETILTSLKST